MELRPIPLQRGKSDAVKDPSPTDTIPKACARNVTETWTLPQVAEI
jgi:hypothetical protein